jgi:DNA-binding MarR family transcriptional regulator
LVVIISNRDILSRAMSELSTGPATAVLVTRLSRRVYRVAREDRIGMSMKVFSTLNAVRDHDGISQQALGELMGVDANMLVLLLNQAEDAGFARRVRDPKDRRRHIVELTDAGRTALDRAEAGVEAVEEEILSALEPEERVQLRALLVKALTADGDDAA